MYILPAFVKNLRKGRKFKLEKSSLNFTLHYQIFLGRTKPILASTLMRVGIWLQFVESSLIDLNLKFKENISELTHVTYDSGLQVAELGGLLKGLLRRPMWY